MEQSESLPSHFVRPPEQNSLQSKTLMNSSIQQQQLILQFQQRQQQLQQQAQIPMIQIPRDPSHEQNSQISHADISIQNTSQQNSQATNPNNVPHEKIEVPTVLVEQIKKRSSRKEQSRCPYKIWNLLSWVDNDQQRAKEVGCGWVSETEFFINKEVLCDVLKIKLNTLNVNLKTLGFIQTHRKNELTYYKNKSFSKSASPQDFERIRNSRCKPDSLIHMNSHAVYFPLLEPLQLFMMSEKDINKFKRDVVIYWEKIVGSSLIFALGMKEFTQAMILALDENSGALSSDYYMIQQVLAPRTPNVVNIFDFAVFLARFGPFNNAPYKIMQYQQILSDIRPDFFMFNAPSLTSYFSMTYHNCFRFQLAPNGEYHCYNLPHISSSAQYLIDEDGSIYKSWAMMLQSNSFLTQKM